MENEKLFEKHCRILSEEHKGLFYNQKGGHVTFYYDFHGIVLSYHLTLHRYNEMILIVGKNDVCNYIEIQMIKEFKEQIIKNFKRGWSVVL